MLNAKLAPVLVMVGVTAAMWGCGDDDKPSTGTGGRAGSAGASGKGGSAGKGGAGAGGTAGATGGTAGKGGAGAGGTAGATGGTSGKGGTAGTAGTGGNGGTAPVGGQGGEGGDAGGAGGEGGNGSILTVAQACAAICQDQMALPCDNACVATCIGLAAGSPAPTEYEALIQCEAAELGPNDYECFEQTGLPDMAGASWDGACETELCAWTCADQTFVEEQTFGHCNCP
jgi:hypothetical protein